MCTFRHRSNVSTPRNTTNHTWRHTKPRTTTQITGTNRIDEQQINKSTWHQTQLTTAKTAGECKTLCDFNAWDNGKHQLTQTTSTAAQHNTEHEIIEVSNTQCAWSDTEQITAKFSTTAQRTMTALEPRSRSASDETSLFAWLATCTHGTKTQMVTGTQH